jgi:hypothetical protein
LLGASIGSKAGNPGKVKRAFLLENVVIFKNVALIFYFKAFSGVLPQSRKTFETKSMELNPY